MAVYQVFPAGSGRVVLERSRLSDAMRDARRASKRTGRRWYVRAIGAAVTLVAVGCGNGPAPELSECGESFAVAVEDAAWYGVLDPRKVGAAVVAYERCGVVRSDCGELAELVVRQCDGAPATDPGCALLVSAVVEVCHE